MLAAVCALSSAALSLLLLFSYQQLGGNGSMPPSSGLERLGAAYTLVIAAIFMPFVETMIFQATFMWLVKKTFLSAWVGIGLSALVFAGAHFSTQQVGYAVLVSILGLFWAALGVYRMSRYGIWQGILLVYLSHGMHNGLIVTLSNFE
ncbi:type II CAAX prenyl endopeptidase Rce1 family protein [Roseateles sp. DC23W]|uniref:Type II CAAX prenyl endopeptidase Rce1 family protein n=1 Tax=Pelomonas dachongensis TaxID=3299029 RepID=A0ABW7EV09_9BURK